MADWTVLDFIKPTYKKIASAIIIAAVILLSDWVEKSISVQIFTDFHPSMTDLLQKKLDPELKQFILDHQEGMMNMFHRISVAKIAVILLFGYLGSCVLDKAIYRASKPQSNNGA